MRAKVVISIYYSDIQTSLNDIIFTWHTITKPIDSQRESRFILLPPLSVPVFTIVITEITSRYLIH